MRDIVVIAHDMRSAFNVGALLRTADGLGISQVYLTGYTPYPLMPDDQRLPHIAKKLDIQIAKSALGAEQTVDWRYEPEVLEVLKKLRINGYTIAALEQSSTSIPLQDFVVPERVALLLGTEVTGIPQQLLDEVKTHIEIPMHGKKESFNVVIAAAIAFYQFQSA